MSREYFNFGNADNYQPKPFVLKHRQNTEGLWNGYSYSSTMTQLTLHGYTSKGEPKTVIVGVKNERDFNFEALFAIAEKSLKRKPPKFSPDSYQKKSKKERKRPQY